MNKGCWEGRKVITYKRQGKWDLEIRRGGGAREEINITCTYLHTCWYGRDFFDSAPLPQHMINP